MEDLKIDDYLIKSDRSYLKSHEWVKDNGDGTWSMGISDYAQKMLKEITYIQYEDVNEEYNSHDVIAVVEALKATGDIYAPFDCTLVAVNEALEDNPELVAQDPYGQGFLLKINPRSDDRSQLLTPEQYLDMVKEELAEL